MAVVYDNAVKAARMTATRDELANGTLEILDGSSVLVVFGLSASGGSVANGVWTIELDNTTVAATGNGTADGARIKDSGGTARVTGLTVSNASGPTVDIVMDNTNIASGQDVTLNPTTLTHA